jgi:lipopolysaccharide/colanic/teichoic acid biosynthesis glycosyltransferase
VSANVEAAVLTEFQPVPTGLLTGLPARDGHAYHIAKRCLDVLVASVILVLVAPVLLIVAALIKVDSPGPAIFAQQRLGGRRIRSGSGQPWVLQPFTMYKFRTMHWDADHALHRQYMEAYLSGDEGRLSGLRPGRKEGDSYRPIHDTRITRVGAVLRKLSLDELPQLWNVLKGDMSLVGPRPPLAYEVRLYEQHQLQRLAARPGITGWAQVRGRCAIGFEEMVRLDLEYVERRSLVFDLWVLLLTLPAVLSGKGAD